MSPRLMRTQRMSVSSKKMIGVKRKRSQQQKQTKSVQETEYHVDEIRNAKYVEGSNEMHFFVKWTNYPYPTWEPYQNVKDCIALDEYLQRIRTF